MTVHLPVSFCGFISFLDSDISLPVKLLLSMVVYVSPGCFLEDLEPDSPSERLKEALSYRDKFQSLYLVSRCFQYVVFYGSGFYL